jgi:hypothetical protein
VVTSCVWRLVRHSAVSVTFSFLASFLPSIFFHCSVDYVFSSLIFEFVILSTNKEIKEDDVDGVMRSTWLDSIFKIVVLIYIYKGCPSWKACFKMVSTRSNEVVRSFNLIQSSRVGSKVQAWDLRFWIQGHVSDSSSGHSRWIEGKKRGKTNLLRDLDSFERLTSERKILILGKKIPKGHLGSKFSSTLFSSLLVFRYSMCTNSARTSTSGKCLKCLYKVPTFWCFDLLQQWCGNWALWNWFLSCWGAGQFYMNLKNCRRGLDLIWKSIAEFPNCDHCMLSAQKLTL